MPKKYKMAYVFILLVLFFTSITKFVYAHRIIVELNTFEIDTEKPTTTISKNPANPDGENGWYISPVEITLSTGEPSSEIEFSKYRIDEGSWQDYYQPFTLSQDGEHTIEYYSEDKAGNQESTKSEIVKIDQVPRSVPVISSSTHSENEWTNNNSPEFSWTEPDDTSGIAGYSWVLDLNESTVPDEKAEGSSRSKNYIDKPDGVWYFHVRTKDNVGHWGETAHYQVKIDTEAPQFSERFHEPERLTGETKSSLVIKVKVTDSLSGIWDAPQLDYKIDGDYDGYENMNKDDELWTFHISKDWSQLVGKTIYYKVKVDDKAENSTESEEKFLSIGDAPQISITNQFEQWENGEVSLEVEIFDKDENLEKVFYKYSLDSTQWKDIGETNSPPYNINWDTSSISCDESVWIKAIAEDATELKGEDVSESFGVDNRLPATLHDYDGKWHKPPLTIKLTADDQSGSGIAETKYKLNDGKEISGTVLHIDNEGSHKLEYWSIDKVGNEDKVQSEIIKVDSTAPTTNISLLGTEGDNNWYVSQLEVTLNAEDLHSGITSTKYRLNSNEWKDYSEPFTIEQDSEYIIQYYSKDNAGNKDKTKSEITRIDSTAPTTNISLSGIEGKNDWYVSQVEVTLSGEDLLSGMELTKYKIDEGEWKDYSEPFIVEDNGEHLVEFYSVDKAGNEEKSQSKSLKIDTMSPTVSLTKAGTKGENGWYLSDVTVDCEGEDATSGVSDCKIQVDNGSWQTFPVVINDEGENSIKFYAVDEAGNESDEQSQIIKLDKHPPEFIHWEYAPLDLGPETEGTLTIRVTITDLISGVSEYPQLKYRTNGNYNEYSDMSSDEEDTWYEIDEDWEALSGKKTYYMVRAFDNAGNSIESEEKDILVEQPEISVPETIDFGTVWVDKPVEKELTINNSGSAELIVTNITTDADDIEISEKSFSIQAEGKHPISLTFTPSSVYEFTGNLSIESNAKESPKIVTLSAQFRRPEITEIEPISGKAEGGEEVTITGNNFSSDANVMFGDKTAIDVKVISSTEINTKVPAGITGTKVNVIVENPDAQTAILKNGFTYKKEASLMLMVSPESIPYKSSDIKVEVKLDIGNAPREQEIRIFYKKPSGGEVEQKASSKETGSNTHNATLKSEKLDAVGTWTATAYWDGNDEYLPVDESATFEVTKAPGEISWTNQSKNVLIDTSVLITGTLKPNIEGETVTLEFTDPDGIVNKFTVKTDVDGTSKKEHTFDSEGNWTLEASWSGNNTYEECESEKLVLHVYAEAAKAIIVLGGDKDSKDFDDFNQIANKIYDVLTKRGFIHDDIYYLNPRNDQDDERVVVDAITSKAELEHAITGWAADYVGSHTPLLIYLLSHNTEEQFLLEPSDQADPHLTPTELEGWLSELESSELGVPITVFMDACSSGNFLKPLVKEGRTVITSTKPNESAHIRLADSFSANFFDYINADYDVKDAFKDASDYIASFRAQHPWLDSNGNGIPKETVDYANVEGVQIGKPTAAKPPTIESVLFLPSQLKQDDSAVISINLSGAKIESVTGVLILPSYDRECEFEHWSELDTGLIDIDFQQSDDVRVYASKPQEFAESGKYILIVHAVNPDGDAIPYKTSITVEPSDKAVQPSDKKITQWGKMKTTKLYQNYPNPFNPDTWIPFQLANRSEITLDIYNIQGEIVRKLELGTMPAGEYLTKDKAPYWDGRDQYGESVASGLYFYQMHTGSYVAVKRMVVLK